MDASLLLCLGTLVAACGVAPSGPPVTSSTGEPTVQSATPTPAQHPVVDLHVDTITAMEEGRLPWEAPSLEAGLPALAAGGVQAIVQAAWIPRGDRDPRGTALRKLQAIRTMVEGSGVAEVVTDPESMLRVVGTGRIAVLLALEGGTALTDGERTLDELRALGLVVVGLTWTERSPYADSSAEPGTPPGLTPAGVQMVQAVARRGMILDVSHMSDQATEDCLLHSSAPVLASHSNLRTTCDVPRNLPSELAGRIGARGGLIGAMFHAPFLRCADAADRAAAVQGIRDLIAVAGPSHVGFGSDWDGRIRSPLGLGSARELPALWEDLRRGGLAEDHVRGVAGGNFVEFWRRVWAQRSR